MRASGRIVIGLENRLEIDLDSGDLIDDRLIAATAHIDEFQKPVAGRCRREHGVEMKRLAMRDITDETRHFGLGGQGCLQLGVIGRRAFGELSASAIVWSRSVSR